ncbi:hypothetical protein [Chromobacterium rhizoryzae]|uniref:hypothetical protein n=1 Tax=Chromobacterium rhizoryzae TaxID=1778675 RepID=UPI001D072ECE|nr:hypothetical protein [Chromobacterium rhizoryzae]
MNFPTMTKRMTEFVNWKDGARIASRKAAQTIEKKSRFNPYKIARTGTAPTPAPQGHDPLAATPA